MENFLEATSRQLQRKQAEISKENTDITVWTEAMSLVQVDPKQAEKNIQANMRDNKNQHMMGDQSEATGY